MSSLSALLKDPASALDWPEYVSRFDALSPFGPDEDRRMFDDVWLVMACQPAVAGGHPSDIRLLGWLDLWIFFCLTRQVPMEVAVKGPDHSWELGKEFEYRRAVFGL